MATIIEIGLTIITALSIVITLLLLATKKTYTRPFVDKNGKIIKDSVAEQFYLPLGGVNQWILLRGRSTHNPILIFLHGGPGISLHALFRYFHHEIENHFILVGWDQRGAGKSYSKSISPESVTLDTFVTDLHELVQYLKKRFNQNKVYILGESWGSLLGTIYAHRYPEDVAAYIGTGQISNMQESEQLGYEFMLTQAEKQNNQKALKQLRNITQPPFSAFKDINILRKWLMEFGGCLYKQRSYLPWILKMLTVDEYAWPDLLKVGPGVNMSLHLLHKELFHTNLFNQVPALKVPVYFLLGKHDHQVSTTLAEQYFNALKAPRKELIWFEKSGHNPMFEEPDRFRDALLSISYSFAFKLIEENDLPSLQTLLHRWFQMPHVAEWWPVPTEGEDFFNSFLKRIRSGTKPYLVLCNDLPIGYLQCYSIDPAKGTWLPKLPGNLIGIDQFIGEPDYLGRGIGTLFIKAFVKGLINRDDTTTIIVDPDPQNAVAIRCYEKVGFKKIGEYQAPWGPALLMVYKP